MSYTNVSNSNRPSQKLSWSQKIANNYKWFKDTADYYISQSTVFHHGNESYDEMDQLYGVYNNDFPGHWFTHITDPFRAKDKQHKRFPAKIRSTNILRTNIDQLIGEYARRPFVYKVVNRGEDGYNRYTTELQKAMEKNLTDHFIQFFQQDALARGLPVEEIPQPEEIAMPWEVKEKFMISYKDAMAMDGQRWLTRALEEYKFKRKFREMFTDWLLIGTSYSYKNIENGNLIYEKVDPRELDFKKSNNNEPLEDGEWVIRRQWYTLSAVVDKFYQFLKEEEITELEKRPFLASPDTFSTHLNKTLGDDNQGMIPVYHVQFKARREIKYRMIITPEGKLQQEPVDEDYVALDGEKLESDWVNEVYQVWRLGKDFYCNPGAVPVQRNSMNNFSSCKLSYNGAKFSPTAKGVFSIFKQGIPWQILHIIATYQLELTIARNKGKIVLVDKNAIPNKDGWDEERFFWFAASNGWGLLNRNQPGVDKSWNQYQVLDMSTFKDIKELIELQNYCREQWDLITGFNDQRRGQTQASSQSGATSQAIFQSNLVTDLLFIGFEDFVETELQGMIDLSRFLNVDGVRRTYNGDMYDLELMDIDPIPYCNADLGVFVSRSPEENEKIQVMKQILMPLVQNGLPASMVAEIVEAGNMSEIRAKLKKMEEIQARQAESGQQAEAEMEARADERMAAIAAMQAELEIKIQEHEYQWKERLALLEGQMDMNSAALLSKDETVADTPDVAGIFKQYSEVLKINQNDRMQIRELAQRERESKRKAETEKLKARTALKNKTSGEK